MSISFADEMRHRLPRILTNLVAMLAVIFLLYLIMPVAYVTSYVIPGVGLVGGVLVGVGALVICLIIEARIYRDLRGLSDAFASYAVVRRKGLTRSRRERLRGALANIGKIISFLILLALISPVLIVIPGFGVVVVILPIVGVLIVLLYGWKSWGIAKEELEKIFKAFAESLVKAFEG